MGWRGTLRSVNAAINAAERDAQRRRKAAEKAQMIADAEDAVSAWEQHIEDITSIHVGEAERMDWHEIANKPAPEKPVLLTSHQDTAAANLAKFKPSVFHIFQGGSEKKRQKLEVAVEQAPALDEKDFESTTAKYENDLKEWEEDTQLARRLLSGDAAAMKEVIGEFQSLDENGLIGSYIQFHISDGIIHACPQVHPSEEIVPNFRRKQLASGKLSESKMPAGQFNEIYQDYVASVALKVAAEVFRLLPVEEVYVTCLNNMLNTKTGHKELMPILSVQFVRKSFDELNLSNIDPSDSLANFNHAMKFQKTKGLQPIEPLMELE